MSGGTVVPRRRSVVAAIMGVELRRLARDRLALFFIVVLPVAVIVVIGATIGGASRDLALGVVDLDGSGVSARVVEELGGDGAVDLAVYASRASLEEDLRSGARLAGVVVPAGFGATPAGSPVAVEVLAVREQDAQVARPVVQLVVDRVGAEVAASAFVRRVTGAPAADALAAVDRASATMATVRVEARSVGRVAPVDENQFSYTAPSNLVLFVFISSLSAGGALVEVRRLGVTRRMRASPVTVSSTLLGFGAVRLTISVGQAALILLIGRVGFGVAWGSTPAVAVLVLVYACVGAGAALLVGALVRNPEQAQAVGIPAGIAMGMLGGCMWPLDIVPGALRTLGHVTPHAWAMDGFVSLVHDGGGPGDIALDLAVLGTYAAVLLGLGAVALQRTLRHGR